MMLERPPVPALLPAAIVSLALGCAAEAPDPDGRTGPERAQPQPVRFYGIEDDADLVVYITERSCSIAFTFDEVRMEILRSVSQLTPGQRFTVLTVENKRPRESKPGGLACATQEKRGNARKFLMYVTGGGMTHLLPSLRHAFAVLREAGPAKRGKAVFVLGEGDFMGVLSASAYLAKDGRKLNGNEAVIQFLRDHNGDKAVRVHMILYQCRDPSAVRVYQAIARENGGQYRHITHDD